MDAFLGFEASQPCFSTIGVSRALGCAGRPSDSINQPQSVKLSVQDMVETEEFLETV